MRRPLALVVALAAVLSAVPAQAEGSYSRAQGLSALFVSHYKHLRTLNLQESNALAEALCEENWYEREELAERASRRFQERLKRDYVLLEKQHAVALEALEKALKDPAAASKRSQLNQMKKEVERLWGYSRTLVGKKLKGKHHPLVRWMMKKGQEAHKAYQANSALCTVREFGVKGYTAPRRRKTDTGRVDCINVNTCQLIELKPDNPEAVRLGRDSAKKYVEAIQKDPGAQEALLKKDSRFERCVKTESDGSTVMELRPTVVAWKLCPRYAPKEGEDDERKSITGTTVRWKVKP